MKLADGNCPLVSSAASKMRLLTVQINNLITLLIIGLIGLIPIIFTPLTTEYFESPKIIMLVGGVVLLYLLWSFSWVLQGKVIFTKTPLDLPLLLLLVVVILSTIFSDSRYISIFGNFPRIQGSAVTWIAYILFYFVLASHIKTLSQIRTILYTLALSATVVALITLLSYFGVFLPFDFAKAANFTPTGSSFSTAALLLFLLPFLLIMGVSQKKLGSKALFLALASLFLSIIILVGGNNDPSWRVIFSPIYLATYFTYLLTFLAIRKQKISRNPLILLIPIAISLLIFLVGYLPDKNNPLVQRRVNFPREIQLPFSTSWQVSGQSFVKNPFLGSGPSTYLFNFSAYKPVEFNLTNFWNLRFDTAFNEYLQVLGTLGALGFLAFFAFTLLILGFSWSSLNTTEDHLTTALGIGGLLSVVLLLVHTSSPVVMVVILVFLAMLIGIHKQISGKVEELTIGIKASKLTDTNLIVGDILPILIFIPIVVLTLVLLWNLTTAVRADLYHRLALNSATTKGIDTYNNLVQAERLNPYIDLYRLDLAQTNFALANSIATAKGPTEASAGGSLTDDDKKTIQQLLSQSITEGRVATTLSPRSAQNWEILASIYRQISGVAQNATDFSLDAYGRAIQRDPNNPVLRLNVGGIYYSVKNYELASRFFVDSANLKPNYANAYYNLSITLRDKGDLEGAYNTAQQVVALLQQDPNNQDYKTASAYLADIKGKLADQQKNQKNQQVAGASNVTPPAAAKNGALQKDNLPSVVDLGQKPPVSTPEAVKKTPQPSASPQPTATP